MSDVAPVKPAQQPRKSKDDGSEDEREGMDDEQEEALERQHFAVAGCTDRRAHNALFTNLKNLNAGKDGAKSTSQTNKASGHFARFIRYIIDFDIEDTYIQPVETLPVEEMSVPESADASAAAAAPAAISTITTTSASSVGMEFVRFRIHGQSFMLNQIRKMIGLVILISRGQLPPSYLSKAFAFDEYSVPTAPSLGLLLQRTVYDAYDAKIRSQPGQGGEPLVRESLNALFLGPKYKCVIDAFRAKWIYATIGSAEMKTASAFKWCARLWSNPACVQQKEDEIYEAEEATKAAAPAAEAAQPIAAVEPATIVEAAAAAEHPTAVTAEVAATATIAPPAAAIDAAPAHAAAEAMSDAQ
jgi:hypothetical protein